MQDPETTSRRRTVVRTLADLTEQYDLPMPLTVDFTGMSGGITLQLDKNDREGVHRWAEVLELGEVTTSRVHKGSINFDSVQVELWQMDGPTPFDAYRFTVWSACDVPVGGEQA